MHRPTSRYRTAATLALMTIALHVLAGDAGTGNTGPGAPLNTQQALQTNASDCISPSPRPYRHLTFKPMQQDGSTLDHLLFNDAAGTDEPQRDAPQKDHCGDQKRLYAVADQVPPLAAIKPCTIQRDVALQSHFMMLRLCQTELADAAPETTSQHARQSPVRKADKVNRVRVMPTT